VSLLDHIKRVPNRHEEPLAIVASPPTGLPPTAIPLHQLQPIEIPAAGRSGAALAWASGETQEATAPVPLTPVARARTARDQALSELKFRILDDLVRSLDPDQLLGGSALDSSARRAVERAAEERLLEADSTIGRQERLHIASDIADEVLGLGPLEPLLRDPTVTEVMLNAHDKVYFERGGIIYLSDYVFRDNAHVLNTIDKILRPLSRRLDDSSPMVDARLPDGSRVNAIIPPLAVHGPSLTIRKFSRELLKADDLIQMGTLTDQTVAFLAACVRARLNVLVSGGTGTGKTTLLNLLSEFIPVSERLITIEDPAELQIKHDDWVSLETRPPNIEGKGQVMQRELVRNALRMRPDRIIVGECRAGEAFDMLQAMNTGHDGSLTTVHANRPRDALARIENMVLMAVELPVQAIREQIASGINLIVHISRMQDGSRKVTHISEIVGMQGSVVSMHDIFLFQGRGVDSNKRVLGQLLPTGLRPHFMERLQHYGEELPLETFLTVPHGFDASGMSGAAGD
jgi:pilus assembly protein CpaF